jgi:hypothetical protein
VTDGRRSPPPKKKDDADAGAPPIPSPETIVSEHTLTSPSGRTYRVVRTNQQDEYEKESSADGGDAPSD